MLSRLLTLLVTATLALVVFPVPARADDESSTRYYLAMGDSLAQGWQPNDSYPPYYQSDGYVPRVYAALSANDPKLMLDNVSCGGESSISMIDGSQPPTAATSCGSPDFYRIWYPHKTQLAEAVSFIGAHKDKIELITLDIGGNDLGFCLFDAANSSACMTTVYSTVASNLDTILTQLQDAWPDAPIVGMTYYNPVACVYFLGGTQTAALTSALVQNLNSVLVSVYTAHGVRVADVAGRFSVGSGLVAEATAALSWTWFCSADHFGDIHANTAGYQQIAAAFLDALED